VHYLERVLEEEREARTEERRRHDTLMAQLMQRIPELESSSEPRESSEAAEEQQGRGESPTPLQWGLGRPYRGPGGVRCSEDERQGPEYVEAHAKANRRATSPIRGGA
jgi:hypothetical protein